MAVRGTGAARLKAAPTATAIAVAVLVVVIAAVTSALVAPGPGRPDASAAVRSGSTASRPASGLPHTDDISGPTRALTNGPAVPVSIQHATELGGRSVGITIDDGPDPRWTPLVLDVLRRHHVHATFCMIGPQARANPALVRRIVAEGHRLCDHTVHHDTAMDHKSFAYRRGEILDALTMIKDASGGARVFYYRAPGGAFTPADRTLAAQHGMRPLGWNIDTKDFSRPGAAAILATLEHEIHNGPVILFHDGGGDRSQTVTALDESLTWLHQQGYAISFPAVG
ncbi:polysaccharide deacetylase family protein [Actinacidiphila acididurans]|uniref:Polysaccharide deacetylase family protein n=1 Tax=Actinacidiphila acididurans TaxID=2784346 RepID=A0ABS2TKN4_9ACTN|nr:polysaccharide deacetylase family protein [Actinacidiphila acididurans]MBM9503637.1 polysaccharide deacetylase family protein [Actinacidiphila acididurans]